MSDLLQEAMTARQSGDIARAKQLISQALVQSPRDEAAWMMLAEVVEDDKLKRSCLERVLVINPNNAEASANLASLNASPTVPPPPGEQDHPVDGPKLKPMPAFTPPFSSEGDQEQQARAEKTYPDAPLKEKPPFEETPAQDVASGPWVPDRSISQPMDAASNPELTPQPRPDADLPWMSQSVQDEDADSILDNETAKESQWLDELAGSEQASQPSQPIYARDDYSVSAEPQLGLAAFASAEVPAEPISPDYCLWENSKAKSDKVIVLTNQALTCANPSPSDIATITSSFAEHNLRRDLLGENLLVIKLDDIRSLIANPQRRAMTLEFKNKQNRLTTHELKLDSPQVFNELLDALKFRLGSGYKQSLRMFSLFDKITPPLLTMLFVAVVGWLLVGGLSRLGTLPAFQAGNLPQLINDINAFVSYIGADKTLLVAVLFFLLSLIWLLNNMRQPAELIVLTRRT